MRTGRAFSRILLGAMASAAVFYALASSALAAGSSVQIARLASSQNLTAGGTALVQATVPKRDWCELSLLHGGAPTSSAAPRQATTSLAEFSWSVPKRIAAGRWRAVVRCAVTRAGVSARRGGSAVLTLRTVGASTRQDGPGSGPIKTTFLGASYVPSTGSPAATGLGGGAYPAYGRVLIPANGWLDGQGVTVYSNGSDGNITPPDSYQCVELINRLITTRGWSPAIPGNANELYANASSADFDKYGNGSGYQPVVGDIVVWGGGKGGYGHVAVVDANSDGLLTVVEQNASPSGYGTYPISSSGDVAPTAYGYYVEGYLHPKADRLNGSPPAGSPSPGTLTTPTTSPGPTGTTAPPGDLTSVEDSATGRNVFYVGTDGSVNQLVVQNGAWVNYRLGGAVMSGTDLASVEDSGTGRNVFYVGTDGSVNQLVVQNGAWVNYRLGGTVDAGTGLTAVEDSATGPNVFYVGTDGSVNQLVVQNGAWVNYRLGGTVDAGTGLTAVEDSGTGRNVFYVGTDGSVNQLVVQNGAWVNYRLGGEVSP